MEAFIRDIREAILKREQEKVVSYFEKDVRSRAVWLALEFMAKRRRMDIEDFAEYFDDTKLEILAGDFMAEYERQKAELEKSGFRFAEREVEEASVDSAVGAWEGTFDSLDLFGMRGGFLERVNQIKVSVTQRQTPPYEAKIEARFEADTPVTGGSYSGSLSMPGVPSTSMKVSNRIPAELIGKVIRRGEAMTSKLTGTLQLKGIPDQPFKGSLPFTISKVTHYRLPKPVTTTTFSSSIAHADMSSIRSLERSNPSTSVLEPGNATPCQR